MNKVWDEYFLDLIPLIASKSKDPSTKVGAITSGQDHGTRTTGFNGFPAGVEDDIERVPERYERPAKYKWTVHAEMNAVIYAAKVGIPLNGCFIYVDWHPCTNCAGAIIGAGIKEVIIDGDSASYNNLDLRARWKEDHDIAGQMFSEAGVRVSIHNRKDK